MRWASESESFKMAIHWHAESEQHFCFIRKHKNRFKKSIQTENTNHTFINIKKDAKIRKTKKYLNILIHRNFVENKK